MITRIEIDGFKTFDRFALDLRPFTAVVGPNASGKSNLFDAIKFVSRLAQTDIRDAMQELRGRPEELFRRCDTVCVHVSGADPVVGYEQLALMQPHASVINPSRGTLVDDAGAHRAVEEGKIFYYVVDDPVDGPRAIHRDHPRIIATNHSGGITVESSARLDAKTFEQVTDAVHGRQPDHVLNPEVLDHPRVRAWLRERR